MKPRYRTITLTRQALCACCGGYLGQGERALYRVRGRERKVYCWGGCRQGGASKEAA
jgi:hypothetical protein